MMPAGSGHPPLAEMARQTAFHNRADARRLHNRLHNPHIRMREEALALRVAQLHADPAAILLEVGCGEGGMLPFLAPLLPHAPLMGVDFSLPKVAFMRNALGLSGVCADATRLPLADGGVATVVCRDLLHHIPWNREGVLAEALRVVRPGGRVVVIESHGRALVNLLFQLLEPAERGARHSTPEQLQRLASPLGPWELTWVEASFLTRGLGYVVGWPPTPWRMVIQPIYRLADAWEQLCRRLLPTHQWIYMMLVITRPAAAPGGASSCAASMAS